METVSSVCTNDSYGRECDKSVDAILSSLEDAQLSSDLKKRYRSIGEVRYLVGYILAGKNLSDLEIDPISSMRLGSRAAHGFRGRLQNIMTISSLKPDADVLRQAVDEVKTFLYQDQASS